MLDDLYEVSREARSILSAGQEDFDAMDVLVGWKIDRNAEGDDEREER